MELKEVQDELTKIKLTEEIVTVEFIKRVFGKHLTVLDLSNHFIFEKSSTMLIKLLKSFFTNKKDLKSLVLQNCMISSPNLIKILKLFASNSKSFKHLDISNNRLQIEPALSLHISILFSKTLKLKSLSLQGNICSNAQAISEIFTHNIRLQDLNLYDTNLSPESLTIISQTLSQNTTIFKLNLGFNAQAFDDPEIVRMFADSVSENRYIEELNLSGNDSLGVVDNLRQFCEGIKGNRSLSVLKLGGVNLEDFGVKVLMSHLMKELPVSSLDIQNNNIRDPGFKTLMLELPVTLVSLDASYNTLRETSSIVSLSTFLIETKSLRKLNISHSFELENLDSGVVDLLCEALSKNDSLSDFLCEGVKIPEDPDMFCYKLNQAIAYRKLSLTYKISAVNCFANESSTNSIISNEKSMKIISAIPSNLSHFKEKESNSQTERKEYVETPDQEPIVNTSRHYDISTSFD